MTFNFIQILVESKSIKILDQKKLVIGGTSTMVTDILIISSTLSPLSLKLTRNNYGF